MRTSQTQVRAGFVGLLVGGAAGFLLLDVVGAFLRIVLGQDGLKRLVGDGEPVVLIVSVPAACAVLGCLVSLLVVRRRGGGR